MRVFNAARQMGRAPPRPQKRPHSVPPCCFPTHQLSGLHLDEVAAANVRRLDDERLAIADDVHLFSFCVYRTRGKKWKGVRVRPGARLTRADAAEALHSRSASARRCPNGATARLYLYTRQTAERRGLQLTFDFSPRAGDGGVATLLCLRRPVHTQEAEISKTWRQAQKSNKTSPCAN